MKLKILITIFIFFLQSCNYNENVKCSKSALIKLAEKEWLREYGDIIYTQKPFRVSKKNDSISIVQGTLSDNYLGGVPYAEINIYTCRVIFISHGK